MMINIVCVLTDGWMKIDLVPQVRRWLEEGDLTHHIKTTCKNCEPDVKISSDHDSRPFLILNTEPMNRVRFQYWSHYLTCYQRVDC